LILPVLGTLTQELQGAGVPAGTTLLEQIRAAAQSFQGVMTGLGIMVGGLWAFWTFVLGRSFAGNIRIWFELKNILHLPEGKVAVVSVKAKNIGRTQVLIKRKDEGKDEAAIRFLPIAFDSFSLRRPRVIPTSVDFSQARSYSIFPHVQALEPDEDVDTDIPLAFGPNSTLIVNLEFTGTVRRLFFGYVRRRWNWQGILDVRMGELDMVELRWDEKADNERNRLLTLISAAEDIVDDSSGQIEPSTYASLRSTLDGLRRILDTRRVNVSKVVGSAFPLLRGRPS